jgi:RimJ/RimL family protein N-acetyltransferase
MLMSTSPPAPSPSESNPWLTSRPPERLRVGDLTLRRANGDDAQPILDAVLASMDELLKFIPPMAAYKEPEARAEFLEKAANTYRERWENGTRFDYVIELDGVEGVVGSVYFKDIETEGELEVGAWIRTDMSEKKLAQRSARILLPAILAMPEVQSVVAIHDENNHRSASVVSRLGFHEAGEAEHMKLGTEASGRRLKAVIAAPDLE